ncbi:hypothetical protein FRC17_003499 [Serendipita sp. 399]|nr:hypothetical protein FRC17_003499 [Serendipita sp. 399]
MASHMEETRVQPTNSVSAHEKSSDYLDEKHSVRSANYEAKPAHINEFDAEGLEANEESELLVNDGNPFPPMGGPEETQQLTFRAVIVGSLLGLIVGASNIYLGLKTGFTFGASLFGAIFGFAILKPLSHALPEYLGGGYFGPKENTTVQTAATAAGGLTGLFVAAVPAMYHLQLMSTPSKDIGRLFGLTALTAFYGVFFAMPLRRYYIRMLSGLNASWSFLLGAVMAWGMLGPISIAKGWTISKPNIYGVDEPLWRSYTSMSAKDFVHGASPRYWLLWPGILIMLCYSFAELAMNAPIFIRATKSAYRSASYSYRSWAASRKGETLQDTRPIEERPLDDPAPEHEQVPFWMWSIGLIASVALTLIVGKLSYGMDVGVGILALILAFIFSFIGVQSSGTTDVNPIGTIAKASQLVIGGVTRAQGISIEKAQLTNLVAGSIAGQAAAHGVDMTGDLKTGHLLRASPRVQFLAQVFGSVIGIWLSVGLFVLFATAYPCITDLDVECTAFGLPSVSAWRTVAVAVTSPTLPIPPSSGYFAIGLSILAIITVVVKHTLIPARFHAWVPNWNAIGLGFVVPQTYYPIAMVVGAHVAYTWARRWPKSWEIWGFALSAGLVAGEGMGGVLTALLTIVKADGSYYGSPVACPAKTYCG